MKSDIRKLGIGNNLYFVHCKTKRITSIIPYRIIIFIGMLILTSPVLHAQDFLQKARNYLDAGECEKAQKAYNAYKVEHPNGDAEVERRIAECEQVKDLIFTVNDISFKMVFVEGGTFQMGSNSGGDDEKPVHSVTVSDFYMGEFEVTQALWQEVMGTTIYQQRDKVNNNKSLLMRGVGANYPMYFVNHGEAKEFCGRLNQRLRSQLPDGYSFALPTEAEWEYAARGGNKSNAYTYSGSNYLSDVAWYKDKSNESTHAVGMKRANELSLYDMSGNVWEWCADWYGAYSSYSQTNPCGVSSGSYRVLRGGGWNFLAKGCRVTYRGYSSPSNCGSIFGFRLALVRR